MPRKSKAAIKRSEAAHKGWLTRKRNERTTQRESLLESIESLLGETFESLLEAIKALQLAQEENSIMWRLTILFNYSIRQGSRKRRKKSEQSPMASGLRLTAWFRTKAELQKKKASLTVRAENALLTLLKANRKLFWKSELPSIAIEDVPYKKGYIGTVEVVNEVEPEDEDDGE
jgi:hypothetical protein